ncbi:MAG: hypothetical protein IKY34_06735 [Ruminiclostridium sp.]|nr:hypothetical protein [Ruminiclostridium sp.]
MRKLTLLVLAGVLTLMGPAAQALDLHFPGEEPREGIYLTQSHLVEAEPAVLPEMTDYAADKIQYIYDTYLAGTDCKGYFAMVPAKEAFLQKGSLTHEVMGRTFRQELPFLTYLNLAPMMALENFYRTDLHWRQENLPDVASYLAAAMGTQVGTGYRENLWTGDFFGTYSPRLTAPLRPDAVRYLTSDTIDGCTVTGYDLMGRAETQPVYNLEKAAGGNPYDLFLSGPQGIQIMENPKGPAGKELVLFRDSFGSSLAPLLLEGYSKITLVDLRYVFSHTLNQYVDFQDQDVLFLYSSLLLNNSLALK